MQRLLRFKTVFFAHTFSLQYIYMPKVVTVIKNLI